jgi:hypothetical protein
MNARAPLGAETPGDARVTVRFPSVRPSKPTYHLRTMPLRVGFAGYWVREEARIALLTAALRAHHDIAIADLDDADVLIFSDVAPQHRSFVGTKVHYSSENLRPPWAQADFCIGFDYLENDHYLRVPLFALFQYSDRMTGFAPPERDWEGRDFCNFIYSKTGTRMRRDLFKRLSAYRPVTSPGEFLNNTSAPELDRRQTLSWRRSKILYQRRFRFTIACENSSNPGYTTEKLYDALVAGTIPIYWGNPRVTEDFDPKSFVNCHVFDDLDEVVDLVRRIDRDPQLAADYLEARDVARVSDEMYLARAVEFFDRVVEFAGMHTARSAAMRQRAASLLAGKVRSPRALRRMRSFVSSLDRRFLRGVLHSSHERLPPVVRRVLTKLGGSSL